MATFVNDTFTGTNGDNLISTHVGEIGATWTRQIASGQYTIQANRVFCAAANTYLLASGTPTSADYSVTLAIRVVTTANVTQMGVMGRAVAGADTSYLAYIERTSGGGGTNTAYLAKRVAASPTLLGSIGITAWIASSDHTIELRMIGSAISMYVDSVLTVGPITDTAITAAGKAGLTGSPALTSTTGLHFDSITATDFAAPAAPEYNYASIPVHRASTY